MCISIMQVSSDQLLNAMAAEKLLSKIVFAADSDHNCPTI